MAATPASMLHIVTQGLQDSERLNTLRGQPSLEFYTAVMRPRSRWASQWRRVEFDNLADFGRRATVTLPILGELITRATLVVELPDLYGPQRRAEEAALGYGPFNCLIGPYWSWTNGLGHALCSNVEFSIGNQVIDRLDSRLLEVLDEQATEIEHWDSKNVLIARDPSAYTQFDFRGVKPTQLRPQTLEITFPFWWNRGPGPQALPIQALAKDKVQITVDFRTLQECVYTDARVNPANPGAEATQVGPMPLIAGCGFYQHWPSGGGGQPIYDMTRTGIGCGFGESKTPDGRVLPGITMPPANSAAWRFRDAYWIVEYVSLEDREAAAYRMADLQIPIEQHVAVPVTPTAGARQLRIPLAQGGLVRDMMWVAQRTEATDYNAYFLFSRDLAAEGATPSQIPWWPDARVPDWDYGDGYLRPGFADRRSDPIAAATLWYRGTRRFDHDGPALFRSLLPILNCRRSPLIDRYIYRYDFGFWPTGGLAEALELERDEVRGFANWDKLPAKELALTMNVDECKRTAWADAGAPAVFGPAGGIVQPLPVSLVTATTPAIRIELRGAANGGRGAIVRGVVDLQAVQRALGPTAALQFLLRFSSAGSVGLLAKNQTTGAYTWLAVAGSGGFAVGNAIGGTAATAVAIGRRGDGQQTHEASLNGDYGGAGGGRLAAAGVGAPDGAAAPVPITAAWVAAGTSVGGATAAAAGGDGYTGGGSGALGGGGGGSYVSRFVSEVETIVAEAADPAEAGATVTPLKIVAQPAPTFNIYTWLTTYNILRITDGRGTLMFSA